VTRGHGPLNRVRGQSPDLAEKDGWGLIVTLS
jgi:hypothetical protein